MAKHFEVLAFLRPDGGYSQTGEDFEGIEFINCEPFTKKEYEDAFAKYDAWKKTDDAKKAQSKANLLERLGITEDEAKLLLS